MSLRLITRLKADYSSRLWNFCPHLSAPHLSAPHLSAPHLSAPHLSAPSAPLFSCLRCSPLGAFGASVTFETVPQWRLQATPPGSRVIGPCRCRVTGQRASELANWQAIIVHASARGPCGLSHSGPFCTVYSILHIKGLNFHALF